MYFLAPVWCGSGPQGNRATLLTAVVATVVDSLVLTGSELALWPLPVTPATERALAVLMIFIPHTPYIVYLEAQLSTLRADSIMSSMSYCSDFKGFQKLHSTTFGVLLSFFSLETPVP